MSAAALREPAGRGLHDVRPATVEMVDQLKQGCDSAIPVQKTLSEVTLVRRLIPCIIIGQATWFLGLEIPLDQWMVICSFETYWALTLRS